MELGKCGTFTHLNPFRLTAYSLQRWARGEDVADYNLERDSTYLFSCSSRKVVPPAGSFSTMAFVIDHSVPTPPFIPLGRGEDVCFAASCAVLHPNYLFAHAAMTLDHFAPVPKKLPESARRMIVPNMGELMAAIVRRVGSVQTSLGVPSSYRQLGEELMMLSTRDDNAFDRGVRDAFLSGLSSFGAVLSNPGVPDELPGTLRTDTLQLMEAIRAAAQDEACGYPLEARAANRNLSDARRFLREEIGLFGTILTIWPRMLEAADQLSGQIERYSCPL
ncbi:MAG: hypothetical protein EA403_01760 [Spirochaetaceae bacterium]|nr:MAG: hypothetical protein EA403_01760 [Spirochaetaceae bacterium]